MTIQPLERFTDMTLQSINKANSKFAPESDKQINRGEKIPVLQTNHSKNIAKAYLISANYDGKKRVAYLKLYDPKRQRIHFWYDNTDHLPYCLSDLEKEELEDIRALKNHPGLKRIETVRKYDPLQDKEVTMSKIIAKDPLTIGGRSHNTIREILQKAWEANIRYYSCYIYDEQLLMGMPYKVEKGKLSPIDYVPPEDVLRNIQFLFKDEPEEFKGYISHWNKLFQCPVPNIQRLALDIEVYSPKEDRIPDPNEANDPIIAVSLIDTEGTKRVLLLKNKEDTSKGFETDPSDVKVEYYNNEVELIKEIFKVLRIYPIILTFNGDDFDLRYIYNRAENLGFQKQGIPIFLGSRFALLKYGIHIDLYRFFFNRSIQLYAFSRKYTEFSLNEIAIALLGFGKIPLESSISELSSSELVKYCLRDSELTLKLTTFSDNLVMKLIFILMRITKLPMEDLTRQGVSNWIRNLMYFEHRRLNYLIPRSEDILAVKGEASSTAMIKGKKFKGAEVVEPKPGVHFNVKVLDFASLYPSIIKVRNLSYETVLCHHPECRDNKIPDLPHWICRLKKGLSSQIIGSLRDLRVKWYKTKAKDQSLSFALRNFYDVVQLTLKVLLNASYGVMGAESFSLYCPPVAEAVTAYGRDAMRKTVDKARSLGIEVLYGDTDSLFLKKYTPEQINELIKWSNEKLQMELEIEKEYRYALLTKLKKNYLGVYEDGNIDIKGLTGKKRHTPQFLKDAFMKMIKTLGAVQSPKDFTDAKKHIRNIVHDCYSKLMNKEYALDDLTLNITISKPLNSYTKTTPQHVKAAKLLIKAGHDVQPGQIIRFIKTTDDIGVKPRQLADLELKDLDVNKYVEYLKSTFDQVLDALGTNFNEILGISKLDSFLWSP
jgi:DNA polymerase I